MTSERSSNDNRPTVVEIDAAAARVDDAMRIFQVALSTIDAERSEQWYREVGFLPAGGMNPEEAIARLNAAGTNARGVAPSAGPGLPEIQGIPGASVRSLRWLVDRQAFFQLELFQYSTPPIRRRSADWRASDIGYSRIGVHVSDLDGTLARLSALGTEPIAATIGDPGVRRVCVFDPDGVLVELMEDDVRTPTPNARPWSDATAVTRSVTLSVPDLERARRSFVEVMGMTEADPMALHDQGHEQLWNLDSARREVALLYSGDIWLELVEYRDPPGRPRPPGAMICDQGILNIAIGSRNRRLMSEMVQRAVAAGYRTEVETDREHNSCLYTTDIDGFSIELYFMDARMDPSLGLVPRTQSTR